MAPVAAAISASQAGVGTTKLKIQSIASPGPAMKPSSDIALFTTTLPFPVLVSLILSLAATAYAGRSTTGDTGRPTASGRPASPGRSRIWLLNPDAADTALLGARLRLNARARRCAGP